MHAGSFRWEHEKLATAHLRSSSLVPSLLLTVWPQKARASLGLSVLLYKVRRWTRGFPGPLWLSGRCDFEPSVKTILAEDRQGPERIAGVRSDSTLNPLPKRPNNEAVECVLRVPPLISRCLEEAGRLPEYPAKVASSGHPTVTSGN